MKATQLSCPHCGASLPVKFRANSAVCEYCRMKVILEEVNWDAMGPDEELIEKVRSLIKPGADLEEIQTRLKGSADQLGILRERDAEVSSVKNRILVYVVPLVIFVLFIYLFINETNFLYLLTGIGGAAIAYVVLRSNYKKNNESSKASIDETLEGMKQMRASIDELYEKNDIAFIPEDYRFGDAVKFFYQSLRNQRAMTLPQAITLFEKKREADLKKTQESQLKVHAEKIKQKLKELADDEDEDDEDDNDEDEKDGSGIDAKDVMKAAATVGTVAVAAWKLGRKLKK